MSSRQLQDCPSRSTRAVYLAPINPFGTTLDLVDENFPLFRSSMSEVGLSSLLSALICPTMRADCSLNAEEKLNHSDCPRETVSLSAVSSLQLLMADLAR